MIDPDTLVVLGGGGCVLRRSDDGGASFRKIFIAAEYLGPAEVQAVTFFDKQTGYILLKDGSLLRTSDGGESFARQTAVPGTQASNNAAGNSAIEIAFTSADSGVAFVSPANNAPSIAFQTTDGGNSWKPVDAVDPGSVRRLHMLDPQTGFAVGNNTLLATTDAGKTWKSVAAGGGHDLTSIRCLDPKTCLLTTVKGDVLLRTSDGGQTAIEITPSSQPIFAAAFASPSRVAAVGANGATVVSDDAGVNYTPISHDIGGRYFDLRPGPNAGSVLALGDKGGLALTIDAGASWKTLAVPTSTSISDAAFPSSATGYALDDKGGLFKSANGGNSWQTLNSGTTARPSALVAPAPDTIVLVGPRGIRRAVGATPFAKVGGKAVAKATLSAATLERAPSPPGTRARSTCSSRPTRVRAGRRSSYRRRPTRTAPSS